MHSPYFCCSYWTCICRKTVGSNPPVCSLRYRAINGTVLSLSSNVITVWTTLGSKFILSASTIAAFGNFKELVLAILVHLSKKLRKNLSQFLCNIQITLHFQRLSSGLSHFLQTYVTHSYCHFATNSDLYFFGTFGSMPITGVDNSSKHCWAILGLNLSRPGNLDHPLEF